MVGKGDGNGDGLEDGDAVKQNVWPALEPEAHGVHAEEPGVEYFPAGQM